MAVPKCWTVKREECATVSVKHCEPQTVTDCDTKVRIPWQEWVHQEKCLFAQDGTLSNSPPSQFSSPEPDNEYRKGRVNLHDPMAVTFIKPFPLSLSTKGQNIMQEWDDFLVDKNT